MSELAGWPAHGTKVVPWRQEYRSGTYEDRTLQAVAVSIPPFIVDVTPAFSSFAATAMEEAVTEIVALDHWHGAELQALGTMLLRTESVASSKIERIHASVDDFARALHGVRANPSASSMVAATSALDALIRSVDGGKPVRLRAITRAHLALMNDDRTERFHAGTWRDVQIWIGGSDHAPRNAMYVPPPPETVRGYMDDLVRFANRDDLPALAQAAIVHAQFESVHPFTDGNGRIGRALINTVLRRRGVTSRVVVPLASALVANRDGYFDLLDDYRAGHAEPIVTAFSRASQLAAAEARVTADRVSRFPQGWHDRVGAVRRGSAAARLLPLLAANPVFSADEAHELIGGAQSSVYTAIERLHDAGVVRPLTERKRNQVWGVTDILDELDDLGTRIAQRARQQPRLG